MKKHFPTILLVTVFFIGLSLLLYPIVSDYWNTFHQSQTIAEYDGETASIDKDAYETLLQDARDYNASLAGRNNDRFDMTDAEREQYEGLLSVSGDGIMGYIEIQRIDCSLPIYHGTDDTTLQVGAGHMEGSSLPTGGSSTHCVISGHSGLPSAKLFTDLDKLVEGDTFVLRVLDETLTYEVDQIHIVLPDELQDLEIIEGEDYCTLVTCTPYGINSHRLLVRGRRVANQGESNAIRATVAAMQMETVVVVSLVAALVLLILLIGLLVRTRRRK